MVGTNHQVHNIIIHAIVNTEDKPLHENGPHRFLIHHCPLAPYRYNVNRKKKMLRSLRSESFTTD